MRATRCWKRSSISSAETKPPTADPIGRSSSLELSEDRLGTVGDFAHVLSTFKMPGDGLIVNYRERLK